MTKRRSRISPELGYITQDRLKSHAGIIERLKQRSKMALVTSVPANFEHDSLSDDPPYNAPKDNDSQRDNPLSAPSPIAAQSEIGALLYNKGESYLSYHPKFLRVPHGGGDSLAALFLAHFLALQPENRYSSFLAPKMQLRPNARLLTKTYEVTGLLFSKNMGTFLLALFHWVYRAPAVTLLSVFERANFEPQKLHPAQTLHLWPKPMN